MSELRSLISNSPLGGIPVPEAIKVIPVYHKFESTNQMVSDTQHGDEWVEQFSSYEKWNISEEDGCIFTFKGKPVREVGITRDGEVLTLEEVDLRLTANPTMGIPLYRQYSFYLDELVKTNGPEERNNLRKSVEQQRAAAEKGLTESIAGAFAKLAQVLSANQAGGVQEALKEILPAAPQLHPSQVEAQRILDEMDQEVSLEDNVEEAPDPATVAAVEDSVQGIVDSLISKNKRGKEVVI